MATSETSQKKFSETTQRPMNFAAFLQAVDTDRMNPANTPEVPLLLTEAVKKKQLDNKLDARLLQGTGFIVSAVWLVGSALYVQRTVGWNNVSSLMPHELGGFLAGILTPIALFWMIAAFVLRSMDVKLYADALRDELQQMIFPSEEANRRVNNDIERLMRQTAEMSKVTKMMLSSLDEARAGIRGQIVELKETGEFTLQKIGDLGTKLGSRSNDVLNVREQLERTLQHLEERAAQSNALIDRLAVANNQIHEQNGAIAATTTESEHAAQRLTTLLQEHVATLNALHTETEAALKNAGNEIAEQRRELRVEAEAIEEKAYGLAAVLDKSTEKLYNYTDDTLDKAKLIETRLQGQLSLIENVLSDTNHLTATIEKATSQAAEQLNNSAENATKTSQKVETILQGAIQRLEETSHTKLQQITARLADSTDKMITDVTTASESAQQSAQKLVANIGETIKTSTDTMLQSITSTSERTKQVTEDILSAVNAKVNDTVTSFSSIQKQIETLSVLFNQRKDDLKFASTEAQSNADRLQQTLQNALDKVQSTTQSLQTNVNSISEAIEQPMAKLESTSALADERAGELARLLDSKAVSLANAAAQINTHVTSLYDELNNKGQDVSQLADKVAGNLKTVTEQLVTQQTMLDERISNSVTSLQTVGREMNTQSQQVTDVSRRALEALNTVNKDLSLSGANVRQATETLQSTIQNALTKVQDTTKALHSGVASISSSVEKPFALLENATVLADQRAKDLANLLESKATTLTSAAAQIGNHVNTLHDQLHGKGQDVAQLAGRIATHLKTVTEELNTQQSTLDQRVMQGIRSLQTVGQELDAQGLRVTDVSKQVSATMTTINQNLGQNVLTLQTLTQAHNALSDGLIKSEAQMGVVSERFVQISSKAVDRIKSTLEDLTLLEADYHRLSDTSIENIQRVEAGYRQTLDNVQQATYESIAQIEQQVGQIDNATGNLRSVAGDIAQTADLALQNVVKVQEAGQNVFGVLQSIDQKAQQADQDLNLVTSHITVHINTISDAMKRAEEVTNHSIDRFVQQGNTLQAKTSEVNANLQQTLDNTSNFTSTIQQSLRQMKYDTEGVEKLLAQSVTKMSAHSDQINLSTTKLMERITQAQNELAQHGKNVEGTGDDILLRLKAATQQMGDRASALEKAAQQAAQQAEALRAQEAKLHRDTFFSSTKFVVESLHSLALDFTRLLDGELPEKTWKAYQKGDLGSFTRRLLSARDEETQQKIRYKFKEDLEFRTYAQRYLRQFEEIYDAAATNDHADLLTTVFLTSDVGKLYQFLCTVLEREKRGADRSQAVI